MSEFEGKPAKEITVELTSVTGVTKDNFEEIVEKTEALFGPKLQEAYGDTMEASVWPPSLSPDEQRKQFEEKDEFRLFFMKVKEEQ